MEEVSLAPLIDEAFSVLQDAAAYKNVALTRSGEAVVFGVKRLLFEMTYNLCDNAIKYNKCDGHVDVRVLQVGDSVRISVKDTGIGIPEDQLSRVFERFYRVDKSHSKQSGGTGLGLSIVKHVVQYHHGKIEVHSKEGVGTEIIIELPIKQENGK